MTEEFQIHKAGEAVYIEKNSKFLAWAVAIESEIEAKEIMSSYRETHPKANHLCYAYRLLNNGQIIENLSDDGEPTHSAGQPILRQIQAESLVNTLVMVIRYFGGVKLGVGGLIKAYKSAAAEAIQAATLKAIIPTTSIRFAVDYSVWGDTLAILDKENIEFDATHTSTGAEIAIKVEIEKAESIKALFASLQLKAL